MDTNPSIMQSLFCPSLHCSFLYSFISKCLPVKNSANGAKIVTPTDFQIASLAPLKERSIFLIVVPYEVLILSLIGLDWVMNSSLNNYMVGMMQCSDWPSLSHMLTPTVRMVGRRPQILDTGQGNMGSFLHLCCYHRKAS